MSASVCLCVCLSICLSASISPGTIRPIFTLNFVLRMAVARSSSGGVAIDVLPVLWVTSYVHAVGQMEACRSMPMQLVTSLRRRGLANAADASNWLRRVLDHVGAETGRVHRARGAGGRARGASVLCCYVSLTSDGK